MAAIRIKTNIGVVTEGMRKKLNVLKDREYLIRPVCFDVIDLMTKRIHIDGNAADGSGIGVYSEGYLKLRQEKYKRKSENKVIVSLTRQLENDWSVIATEKGYGVGFLNPFNMKKARWVEEGKHKNIFSLSASEKAHVITSVQNLVRKALE